MTAQAPAQALFSTDVSCSPFPPGRISNDERVPDPRHLQSLRRPARKIEFKTWIIKHGTSRLLAPVIKISEEF